MIEIKNLTKRYGRKKAVNDVSFTVQKGEILGFLGPNGAGKTTTMNILTGYISSNEGTVTVDGFDILKNPEEVKKRIGYLPENPPLYLDMTVIDYLNFVYDLKNVKLIKKEHINEIMDLVKITDVSMRLIKNLSKGYKQRVGLAQALIGDPEILVLDEPTVGLDPKQINEIRALIKKLGKERTIILSSHILPEVSAICERVIIINKGKIIASDTLENISKNISGATTIFARIEGNLDEVTKAISSIEGVDSVSSKQSVDEGANDYTISTVEGFDIRRPLFFALSEKQFPILLLSNQTLSLEDVFLQLTTVEKHTAKVEGEANNDSHI